MDKLKQIRYMNKWQKKTLERIAFVVPKGERDIIKEYAKKRGYTSTNSYLYDLIQQDMKKDRPD